jgi:hypothetical protein
MSAGLPAALADAIAAEQAATVSELGIGPTLWLAAAPLWTRSAAEACGFPAQPLTEFIAKARRVGWCETRGSLLSGRSGELRFWMPDQLRRGVIDVLGQWLDTVEMTHMAISIAERLMALPADIIPDTLRDWAELMIADYPGQQLVDRVGAAVGRGDVAAAQSLFAAGQSVAPLLATTSELAVDRARRLVNLGARRRQDSKAVELYLDRQELSDAVSALLRPDAARWALHLRGVGGVGKTMLIRYLASGRFAAERDLGLFPVARADFDHISADYPVRRPVQLLLEIADELALHTAGSSGADRALSAFRATAVSAHEALSGRREDGPPTLEHPLVLRAIDAFGQALDQLGDVLLILDTCEELSKADADNPGAPALRATLGIIERLHEQAPSTRVLFAGRRPLPAREYLAIAEVAGFTVSEARDYLGRFSSRELAPDLADAMIRQSAAVDTAVPAADALPDRVSPFDLALYLSWAEEDPGLDRRRIAAGSDAYVDGRIIARLGDPAAIAAVPVLAALGRCRVDTLLSLLPHDTDEALSGTLGARLAEQEWIHADGDPPVRLTVQPALTRRLRHYYGAAEREAGFAAMTARVARMLRDRLAGTPLADIDVDELLAALRLSGPADAAGLWDGIVRQAEAPPGRWGWIQNVADRVLGESQEDGWPTADALRGTVIAAQIAGRRRTRPQVRLYTLWREVKRWADSHPDPAMRDLLQARAACGMLHRTMAGPAITPYLPDSRQSDAAAPAALDAVDGLLESGRIPAVRELIGRGHLRAALDGAFGTRVQAWALVVLSRAEADRDRQRALDALAEAERLAAAAGDEPAWADWIPPEDLLARVRIERGLLGSPDTATLGRWEAYAAADVTRIDNERLASLCLRLRLGAGSIDPTALGFYEGIDRYHPGRLPACTAHELVPPLFVTLAEAELAAGRLGRALKIVQRRRDEALGVRQEHADDPTLRAADGELIRLARRFRLVDESSTITRLAAGNPTSSRTDLRDAARRAMAVLIGGPGPGFPGATAADWHVWWQCQSVPPVGLPPMSWLDRPGTVGADEDNIELDLEEMRLMGRPGVDELRPQLATWRAMSTWSATPARSADPFRDVRVDLRLHALSGTVDYQSPTGVPVRYVAEAAFDEAELLALRLPKHAARLFRVAALMYAQLPDPVGQVLATVSAASLGDDPADRESLLAAFADLRRAHPDLADMLTGPKSAPMEWAYWALRTRELLSKSAWPEPVDRPGSQFQVVAGNTAPYAAVYRSRLAGLKWAALAGAGLIAGLTVVAVAATSSGTSASPGGGGHPGPAGSPWWEILLIVLGGLAAVIVAAIPVIRRIRRIRRLTSGLLPKTIGPHSTRFTASFRIGHLGTLENPAEMTGGVRLLVEPARPRDVPGWRRLGPALLWPFFRLAKAVRRRPSTGYRGEYTSIAGQQATIRWEHDPAEDRALWRPGATATGSILLRASLAAQPWERILSESIGPGAIGRIEWVRHLETLAAPYQAGAAEITVEAPSEWGGAVRRTYSTEVAAQAGSVGVRHVIGRAIATTAGPRLDVRGEAASASGTAELLDARRLLDSRPALVVIQAEPTDQRVDAGLQDDAPERLALAAELIENGAPAVLVVPVLPVALALIVPRAAVAYGPGAPGWPHPAAAARLVAMRIRLDLLEHVEPSFLDDIVLFVNGGDYE